MDSAKQTAAPGFLAPEGESKKKKRERKKGDSEGQQNKRGKKKAEEVVFCFHGIQENFKKTASSKKLQVIFYLVLQDIYDKHRSKLLAVLKD